MLYNCITSPHQKAADCEDPVSVGGYLSDYNVSGIDLSNLEDVAQLQYDLLGFTNVRNTSDNGMDILQAHK